MRSTALIAYVVVIAGIVAVPTLASAQASVGVRYGQGRGSAAYNVGEVHGRLHLVGRLYAAGAVQIMGGNWACALSPVNSIVCGYDGRSISLGPGVALVRTRRTYIAARASVGWFERTGTYGEEEYRGSDHATFSVGGEVEVAVWGPLRLQVGVAHRRIRDGVYEAAAGTQAHFTALMVGVGLGIGGM